MTRIAFVNVVRSQRWENLQSRYEFPEPTHLLAMHNICNQGRQRQGHKSESAVFQYGYPSSQKSVTAVKKFKPDILGLSFVGPREEDFRSAHELIRSFGEIPPHLVIGGTDTTHNFARYLSEFSSYFSKRPPFFIVRGAGEHFFTSLAGADFDFRAEHFYADLGLPFDVRRTGAVISDLPRLPLNSQGFARPLSSSYPLWRDRVAQVKWVTGCWERWQCSFCSEDNHNVDFRSPEIAEAEVKYLVKHGIHNFSLTSQNFTAHPRQATAIMARVQKWSYHFDFASRVDTLYSAIRINPECWREFGRGRENRIGLGAESLLAVRLAPGRIGKYISRPQAEAQDRRLRFILEFFRNSNVCIRLFMIPFDWQANLDELQQEFTKMSNLMDEFAILDIPFDLLGRNLFYVEGSPCSQTMRPEDYFNFKRDPRALILWALLQGKIAVIQKYFMDDHEARFGLREATRRLISYVLVCLKGLEDVKAERFDISPSLVMSEGGNWADLALKILLLQLTPSERNGLKEYFAIQFAAAFPEIAAFYSRPLRQPSALERFLRALLS